MGKQNLVTRVRKSDMQWSTLPVKSGKFLISRPFTERESPSMGGGLVELEDAEMEWTPNYDEMVIVLDGEMSIVHNGEDLVGRPGDMFLIRYGADIKYKSRTKATFAWVLYPANWRHLRWPE